MACFRLPTLPHDPRPAPLTAENGQPWTPLVPQERSRVLQPTPAVCPVSAMRAGVWARGGSTRIRTGNQRPTPYLGSRKMVGVTLDARPPNSHAQPGEPPEPLTNAGTGVGGRKRQTPKNPPPLQTGLPKPHAPEPLSPLIGEGTTYAPYIGARHSGLANPAPSARDVWLMRVGGPGPGSRRNFGGRD